ncbi:MAG: hypothetical protein BWY76_00165 [bacterium ADurb.Bin429]|nr:MAG: hypothetical protein BWY76_00165 [bacterium ADurb.Bin429]
MLHFALTHERAQGLVAAPHQGHLSTLIDDLEYQLTTNPALEASVARTARGGWRVQRKPYYRLAIASWSASPRWRWLISTASFEVLQFLSMTVVPLGVANTSAQIYHFVGGSR